MDKAQSTTKVEDGYIIKEIQLYKLSVNNHFAMRKAPYLATALKILFKHGFP